MLVNFATLSDGTTTIDLTELPYLLLDLKVPNPQGETRQIVARIMTGGISTDDLHARERDIRRLGEVARLWTKRQWGRKVTLTFRLPGASSDAIADVISYSLDSVGLRDGLAQNAADIQRLGSARDTYDLTLTCRKYLRGPQITLATQTAMNKPAGIDYRYVYDDSGAAYVNATNLAGQNYGRLFSTARDDSSALTVAVNDFVALGDATGRFTRLAGGVDVPLAHSGAVWALQVKTGASTWAAVSGLTLYNDRYPDGIGITNVADAFTTAGEFELRWTDPGSGWASQTENTKTAQWARIIVTTLGTVTTYPTLAYGPLRNGRGLIRIPAAQVPGDAPASVKVVARNGSGVALRQVRMALQPLLRRGFGIPVIRHQAEFATTSGGGSVVTGPGTTRGGSVLSVTSSVTDFGISFDGTNNGYLDFGTTPAALANLSAAWTVDFWLRPFADAQTGKVSSRPQPIFGSWDAPNNKRKFLILLEGGVLTVLLSRNGTDVIRYAKRYDSRGNEQRTVSRWTPLKSSVALSPNTDYFCRVARAAEKIWVMVAPKNSNFADSGGLATQAATNRNDSLGTNALYTTSIVAFRLGQQVGLVPDTEYATDFESYGPVQMLNGRVDQLRIVNAAGRDISKIVPSNGHLTGNDSSGLTLGLYEFNTSPSGPGVLVNSQTSGTPMGSATRSATYPVDVTGMWSVAQRLELHGTLRLPWWLVDAGRGRYRVYAIAYGSTQHQLQASQGGYFLTPDGRSPTVANTWQAIDLGRAQVPWQQASGGYTPYGSSVDRPEDLGFHSQNSDTVSSDLYVDELVTLPEEWWRVAYDAGPTSSRWLDPNESLVIDSICDPPQVGQLDSTGHLQLNPERNGTFGVPPTLWPGVDQWLLVDVSRGTSLESHPDDTVDVTLTVESNFVSVNAVP